MVYVYGLLSRTQDSNGLDNFFYGVFSSRNPAAEQIEHVIIADFWVAGLVVAVDHVIRVGFLEDHEFSALSAKLVGRSVSADDVGIRLVIKPSTEVAEGVYRRIISSCVKTSSTAESNKSAARYLE